MADSLSGGGKPQSKRKCRAAQLWQQLHIRDKPYFTLHRNKDVRALSWTLETPTVDEKFGADVPPTPEVPPAS